MGKVISERKDHREVEGGDGQGGNQVARHVGPFVLSKPCEAGDIVRKVPVVEREKRQ